ncbi:type III secretion system LEE effector EspF [Escherichia coli]|uniref:EspF n=3 Tax=Escherichia coli TaxID=562 RepID=B5ARP6_ECOLX|nr:type III secretion system LEE effector EspF [Escherichia coli]EEC7222174.1 type III secretion system LEE effector EspF [Escherichia coli O145]EER1776256.1 type III secretion system LEE effector EspF [Escherichia coli O157]EET3529428.1 type III secretion system LEE effector EspF [Escherichia coli O157:NM]EFW7880910.1 type III secretion system LEE effector EspF [Shigella sonnei]EJY0133910.1 type III secretion system LEE effector EspF [Escherichia coli O76]EJY0163917.1 type III secretion syst
MLNGISNAASTLGRQLVGIASRVSSAGGTGFSVAPQAVRLTPVKVHSPFSPGSSNVNARTIFNVSSQVTSFTPSRPAPPPPTSGQASGASRPLPPIAQALKEHLAAYEKSKGPEALGFKPARQAPPPPTSGQASGASRPLPPIAQALKEHLAAYEKSKGPEALGFKPARQAPPPPTGPSGLPPLAQALKDHLAAYEQSKKG